MTPIRLLIAEDDPQLLEVIVDLLPQCGYVIAGRAQNFADAMQLMANIQFDCAVVDVKLFGVEVCPLIEQFRKSSTPYVLISGTLPMDIETPWLRELPKLTKPFGVHELIDAIDASVTKFVTQRHEKPIDS